MSTFIKATRVNSTALGLLQRRLTLPALVWGDALGDFAGAYNDTVSIRLPAYAPARSRALRAGTTRVKDSLVETKVDVVLDTDVYKDIGITDEELTLDIANFGSQVLDPVLMGVGQKLEDELAETIEGATYEVTITHDISDPDDPYETVVDARTALNNANVPFEGRALVVGSQFEAALLKSSKFVNAQASGSTDTLREALIGRIAGFDVYTSPAISPSKAYAFHRTAFAMVQRAPIVPAGAPWGASQSYQGLAIRTLRVFDPDLVEDRFIADAWVGSAAVTDDGTFDSSGRFVPAESGTTAAGPTRTISAGEADDDTITSAGHGFVAGDEVRFPTLTGGTGLTAATTSYYVISSGLTADVFKVSATPGGSAVNFSTDITAGTVAEQPRPLMVRAVKIAVQA